MNQANVRGHQGHLGLDLGQDLQSAVGDLHSAAAAGSIGQIRRSRHAQGTALMLFTRHFGYNSSNDYIPYTGKSTV